MDDLVTRVPPHSVEAEQMVLASVFADHDQVGLLGDLLEPRHFYRDPHGVIYRAMRQLHDAGGVVDLTTLAAAIGDALPAVGGYGYLVDLACMAPTAHYGESYARIVRDKATLRGLIAAGAAIADSAFDSSVTAENAHAAAVAMISGLEVGDGERDDDMGLFLQGYMDRLEERGSTKGGVHFSSGWYDLDQVWTGARGDLTILAARPSMGKTAWALNYAWHVSQASRVDFWSLEMDRDRLMDRLVLMTEGIDPAHLKGGRLNRDEWDAVARTVGRVEASGLRIRKPKALTAAGVRRATLKAAAKGQGPGLVVIDYMQLMTHPRAERHDLALGATSRALKLMAGEAGCQVLTLSQLNRATEKEGDKRPGLSNLRGSGDIEQDADAVIFIHREAYYDKTQEQEGPAETIVAKHRNGAVGTVTLQFVPRRQLFNVPQGVDAGWAEEKEPWFAK